MIASTERDIALAEIRRRKAKLERFEELFANADGEDLELLRSLLPKERTEVETAKATAAESPQPENTRLDAGPRAVIHKLRGSRRGVVKRGLLDRQVRNAVAHLGKGINVHTVFSILDKDHFRFGAENPMVSIGSVLRKLQKREVIRQVAAASGRRPAEYEIKTGSGEGGSVRTMKTI